MKYGRIFSNWVEYLSTAQVDRFDLGKLPEHAHVTADERARLEAHVPQLVAAAQHLDVAFDARA